MSLNFDDLIKKALQKRIAASPKKHSQKTPDCFSYSRFESIAQRTGTLTREEEKHLKTCPYCQKFLAVFQEEVNLEAAESIGQAFSDSKTIKERAMEFFREMIAPLDVEAFESAWSIFFSKLFDWDKVEYMVKPQQQSGQLAYSGMGFMPADASREQEDTVRLLITIAEMKLWLSAHTGEEPKELQSALASHFRKDESLRTMANEFIGYLASHHQ